jgi:CRP-like cAMP-binding protein
MRYRVLHDGRRQVLNIVLPGDFIGFPGCFFDSALYSIATLSEAVVSAIPFACLPPSVFSDIYRKSADTPPPRRRRRMARRAGHMIIAI